MFIDIHVHVAMHSDLPWREGGEAPATPEQLLEMHAEVGIEKAVMLPFVTPECNILTQSNEDILMIAQKYPDHFIPFCNIDPRLMRNTPQADLSYAISHYKDLGCRGIGEVTPNLYFDDPRVVNLFDHAEKCEMPLLFHIAPQEGNTYGLIDDLHLPRFEKQVQAHPDLIFLCHSGAWWSEISGDVTQENRNGYPDGPVIEGGRVVELMTKYPTVYGDLSAGSGYNAVSRDPEFGYWFLNEFQDQLCFGTDAFVVSCRDSILRYLADFLNEGLAAGKISQEVFDKIAHKNAARILKP